MTSQRDTLRQFTDAAADAVARAIAGVQRDALRERELRDAEHRARLAELDLRIAAVTELERQVTARLASLKDGEPGKSVTLEDVAPLIERAVAAIPAPVVDPEIVREIVKAEVAALPPAEPGKDADPELVRQTIIEAVAALPPPENGKDVDMDVVTEKVTAEVERVLAGWEKPKDGNSVTIEDVRPLIGEEVARAVSEIPKPKDGEPGKLPIVRAWADEVVYAGDVRSHGGSTWQAVKDTAKEPPHDDWICIARGGQDGRSFTVRGTYEAEGAYRHLDVVALNGAAFVARRDEPGACPGDGWQMISMQGKQGKPGPAIKGDPGRAASVMAMSVDDNGVLTIRNADGSTVDCDLYPLLSRLG